MNTATIITATIPTFAVLLGILFNRQEIASLRAEMGQLRNDLNRDMMQLRKDINSDMVQLRDSIHRDMIGLHERLAVVEAKQAN